MDKIIIEWEDPKDLSLNVRVTGTNNIDFARSVAISFVKERCPSIEADDIAVTSMRINDKEDITVYID